MPQEKVAKICLYSAYPEPFNAPRPAPGALNVPVNTSFFIQLCVKGGKGDKVDSSSLNISLISQHGRKTDLLKGGKEFEPHYTGEINESVDRRFVTGVATQILSVYIEPKKDAPELDPLSVYTIKIDVESVKGILIDDSQSTWNFTTAEIAKTYDFDYELDIKNITPVKWHGRFFSGIARTDFCCTEKYGSGRYDMIKKAQEEYPNAWHLQRDAWLSGFEHQPYHKTLPNLVREKETRRIVSMSKIDNGVSLKTEDFFGHEQYGIESGRPLSEDYHKGDEIHISDAYNNERAFVLSVNDAENTILVSDFPFPDEGWKIEYSAPLPEKEDPKAPGLFPPGGTYLRKYNPSGTPCYYFGRLDHEWDLVCFKYNKRVIPRFADAPGDLSVDGQWGTTAKDYVKLREATYTITSHCIERYGDRTLSWPWTVMNEPDLHVIFWRIKDWNEMLKFYDYTVDAILRAFEDHGYDSNKVFVGGLELGAIAGTKLKLKEFLAHCSPNTDMDNDPSYAGVLAYNAAYADPRLDGKRSRRVEELCSKNNGRGSPVDFVSVHTYNSSEMAAAKLIRAKEMALEIDPVYYNDLWINDFESVPEWRAIPDPGAKECYLGNGYFVSWAADFICRMIQKGVEDSRYAMGESILTIFPRMIKNFASSNDFFREIDIDINGDGIIDESVIIPNPIFHFVNLMSTTETKYWALPFLKKGGHTVSGYAAPGNDGNALKIVLYSHDPLDTQTKSENEFVISLSINGFEPGKETKVEQISFNKVCNSFYEYSMKYRDRLMLTADEFKEVEEASKLKADKVITAIPGKDGKLELKVPVKANGTVFVNIQTLTQSKVTEI